MIRIMRIVFKFQYLSAKNLAVALPSSDSAIINVDDDPFPSRVVEAHQAHAVELLRADSYP